MQTRPGDKHYAHQRGRSKAVLFDRLVLVVTQIEVEGLVSEGDAGLPVEIGRQRKTASRSLIAEPRNNRRTEIVDAGGSTRAAVRPNPRPPYLTPGAQRFGE